MIKPQGRAAAAACRNADAVIVGGGTVFGRLHASTGRRPGDLLRRLAALTGAARAFGHPVVLSGVGAAPVVTAAERALVRGIALATDLLVLRDEESAALLRAAGVPSPFRVGADPVWTVLDPVPATTRTVDVLVVMSHLAAHRGLVGWLAAALRSLPDAPRVTVAPWQRGASDDTALAAALVKVLRGRARLALAPTDLEDGAALAATAEVTVCLRFHGAMASAVAGTPFVAVGHEPKLVALARRLGAPAVSVGCPAEELAHAIRRARADGPASAEAIRRERQRAEESLRLVRLLLSGGTLYDDAIVPSLSLVDGSQ
jgi:polysaccharide pyruvyl transferase WcaK-like protein